MKEPEYIDVPQWVFVVLGSAIFAFIFWLGWINGVKAERGRQEQRLEQP